MQLNRFILGLRVFLEIKGSEHLPDILRSIGIIDRALDTIANIEFKEVNLTRGQYLYLVRVYEHPGIILERLANLIKVDKTTAARAIQKMEKNGLLERKMNPANKKQKQIYVTDKGRQVYPLIHRENLYSNEVALTGISPDDQVRLHDLLEQVAKNIEDDYNTVKRGEKRQY